MLKKFSSASLIVALLLSIGGTSALASNSSGKNTEPDAATIRTNSSIRKAESSRKLRGAMDQLVTEAKAGKLSHAERPQIQPAKSNNLSKKTKIAIGVGIAVAVIAIIVIKHERDSLFDNLRVF